MSEIKRIIQCKYSCFKCGISKQVVSVRFRESEDVVTWLNQTCAAALSADHDRRSPHCKISKLDEVWIPVPEGTEKLGTLPDV